MDLGTVLTAVWALLGFLFSGSGLILVRSILKALKESTEVGTALDNLVMTVKEAEKDGVWTSGEIENIKNVANNVKKEAQEAKDAWEKVHASFNKLKFFVRSKVN